MADDKVEFKLDLDIKEFTEKGLQAKGVIEKIGSAESLTGLIEGLAVASTALIGVGLAVFGVKEAFDFTLEGEEIERINHQFETLSAQAGLSGDALKEGLEKSSLGLIDTTDLLKVANKALVSLGGSAQKLPELMTLATKSSQVYGGTAKENFELIAQAVENGNVRLLKQKGFNIDVTKAVNDYAAAHNMAANEITESGRRQAILNAVLEQGKERFQNVNLDVQSATNQWQIFKNTLTEVKEAVTLLFERALGPVVRGTLKYLNMGATAFKDFFKNITHVDDQLKDHQVDNIKKLTKQSDFEKQTRLENEIKFKKELQKINEDSFKLNQQDIHSLEELESAVQAQELSEEHLHQQKLAEIKQQYATRETQRDKLIAAEKQRFALQSVAQEQQLNQLRIKLLDNYKAHSTSAFQGIGRSFQVMSMKAKSDWIDFGKRGDQVVQSFETHSTEAFESIGEAIGKGQDVAQAAANAMKGFFLNMLADRAIGEGQLLLLSGIWPPNPVALAAGAGLITLGGALKGLAGSSGGGGGGISGGGGGGGGPVETIPATDKGPITNVNSVGAQDQSSQAVQGMSQMQSEQRAVSVNIAGNYFDTDTTRKQLMEMIRQETNATDFQYNRIGV